ncbi:MAG: mRNA-degrading endonuclease [Caedibacter sp. 37-49]|nr:MAG: mRNA-degrading endonuclease [Caedibacter sp. 37-49]
MVKYAPQRGDIVWLEFDPQKEKEIQKTRPALVLSPLKYNEKIGLALFASITSQVKGYPFESALDTAEIQGAVLCDQIRSLDWRARKATYITRVDEKQVANILQKLMVLLD